MRRARPGQRGARVSRRLGRRFLVARASRPPPDMDEGGLSKFKAFLVSRQNLAAVARRCGLGAHLRLGRTAERGDGRSKDSLLADALEAVIAAVHLDGGDAAPGTWSSGSSAPDRRPRARRNRKEGLQDDLQEALQAGGSRRRATGWMPPRDRPTFPSSTELLVRKVLASGRVAARRRPSRAGAAGHPSSQTAGASARSRT